MAAKNVLITGVSTGIGHGTAATLCQRGYRVFGSIRDGAQAEALQREFGPSFTPLVFDVTDVAAIAEAAAAVERAIGDEGLFGLINNAGISDPGPLAVVPPDNLRRHFEVNVIGALHMVQACLPLLRKKGAAGRPGRIVNMSSTSGRIAFPFIGSYAASKHALEGLSDSLRRELMIYGVDVIVMQPGPIDTPIWDKAQHVQTAFKDTDYGPFLAGVNLQDNRRGALPVSRVTDKIVEALESVRPKVRYAIPDKWLLYWVLPRLLPTRWIDRIVAKTLNFRRIYD